MKLTGMVNGINRRAADRQRGGVVGTEKRGFMIQVRPATPSGSYYGYGSMDFYLNGKDLDNFTDVELGDELDIYVVKQGTGGEEFSLDDLRHELTVAEGQLAQNKEYIDRLTKDNKELHANLIGANERLKAAATVNAQLMAQIDALKLGRTDLEPPMITTDAT